MKLLHRYGSQQEAMIYAGMLESNGIKCEIVATDVQSVFPAPDAGAEQYDLCAVVDEDAPEAMRLLAEHKDLD